MENPNPVIHETAPRLDGEISLQVPSEPTVDYIFGILKRLLLITHSLELLRDINDPEYPNTLEQLAVVVKEQIHVKNEQFHVRVDFTPTIPHCSMATLIGLCIRVRLMRVLSSSYEIDVYVMNGAHVAEDAINKQLNDKERVAAAMENPHLSVVVERCLSGVPQMGIALSIT